MAAKLVNKASKAFSRAESPMSDGCIIFSRDTITATLPGARIMSKRQIILLSLIMLFPLAISAQDAKQELDNQLWEAARKGDVVAVKTLLDKGANVNAK